jgi:hypothetical protein
VLAMDRYHAVNEPICMYNPGTKERAELDKALEKFNSQVFDIPVVIGDEEVRAGRIESQLKVSTCCIFIMCCLTGHLCKLLDV